MQASFRGRFSHYIFSHSHIHTFSHTHSHIHTFSHHSPPILTHLLIGHSSDTQTFKRNFLTLPHSHTPHSHSHTLTLPILTLALPNWSFKHANIIQEEDSYIRIFSHPYSPLTHPYSLTHPIFSHTPHILSHTPYSLTHPIFSHTPTFSHSHISHSHTHTPTLRHSDIVQEEDNTKVRVITDNARLGSGTALDINAGEDMIR
jgi:hypothetical protein